MPYIQSSGEHKSKPTQHSVKELQSFGIMPDLIVTRCNEPLEDSIVSKIALFCNVKPDCVIENRTVPVLYQAPVMLHDNGLDDIVCRELSIQCPHESDMSEWNKMLHRIEHCTKVVKVALVGKYTKLHDAYLSVAEALRHAGFENESRIEIQWTDSETITPLTIDSVLSGQDAILVPGGFGDRGIEGMILAAEYARTKKIPYLGICLGMQIAVIEFGNRM